MHGPERNVLFSFAGVPTTLANALRAAHNRLMRSADGPEPLLPRWLSCLPKEWLQEQAAEPQPATVTKAEQAKAVAEMARAEKEWSEGRESFSGQRSSDGRSDARLAICCALGLAGLSVRLWKEGPLLLDGLLVCRGPSTAASFALPHLTVAAAGRAAGSHRSLERPRRTLASRPAQAKGEAGCGRRCLRPCRRHRRAATEAAAEVGLACRTRSLLGRPGACASA